MTIIDSPGADPDTKRSLVHGLGRDGDSASRQRLFETLKLELAVHATAGGRYFFVPSMHLDLTITKTRPSVARRHTPDERFENFRKIDAGSSTCLHAARKFKHALAHHFEE